MITVHAPRATRVDVSVFDDPVALRELSRLPMTHAADGQWTLGVELPVGTVYGLRADGPGLSPERILLDPRARAIARPPTPLDPLGAIVDESFDWGTDARPSVRRRDSIIYEAHVRGLTMLHPEVPTSIRGTFLGVASAPIIAHLQALGATAIELLPIHAHADEPALVARGLTNYWGYNSLSFFAPDPRFATDRHPSSAVREFKTMVKTLHAAGIEVILDVVYNHTAEGAADGPTLSWRGLDEDAYRRDPETSALVDWTGCGNTVNTDNPAMRALILDSLRYWTEAMHVDGFRFDLAGALGRQPTAPNSLMAEIQRDPRLAGVKLIVEPWDAAGNVPFGDYPAGVVEWNDRYRDGVRRFWRGDGGTAAEFVTRVCGSEDVLGSAGRTLMDGLNFVTAHDGFTLADLVAYSTKHNERNGEGNRDGTNENFSSNAGVEGPTRDAAVLAERQRRQRSLFATLMVSLGVPMISGGDELGRTQLGNNNAYCHDGPSHWTTWPGGGGDAAFLEFARRATALRRRHPAFHRDRYLTSHDVTWLTPSGQALTDAEWHQADLRAFGMWIGSDSAQSLLVYFNSATTTVRATLPSAPTWRVALDSGDIDNRTPDTVAGVMELAPVSVVVLERQTG